MRSLRARRLAPQGRSAREAALNGRMLEKETTDALFERFMQMDVDACGRVSRRELARFLVLSDLSHSFVVDFSTADTGITWGDDSAGSVSIASIEPGSPADDQPDVLVGLKLVSANGLRPPSEGAKGVRRMWRQFGVHEHMSLEFFEPWLITNDFMNSLDIEIDDPTGGSESKDHGLGTSLFGNPLPFLRRKASNASVTTMSTSEGLLIITAKLPSRAYAAPADVERALGDALAVVAPKHFDISTAVKIDVNTEKLTISAKSEAKIRVLAAAGPSRFSSMHRNLGFPNKPHTAKSAQSSASRRAMSLKLGFREAAHVRAFADELLQEFDANFNGGLEFDEFRDLYNTHFSTTEAIAALRKRIKIRFRTEEELRQLAELEEIRRRRERFRKDLDDRREQNRNIRSAQLAKIRARSYKDCDDTARRGHYQRITKLEGIVAEAPSPAEAPQAHSDLSRDERRLFRKQKRNLERREQFARRNERLKQAAVENELAKRREAEKSEWRRFHCSRHLSDLGFHNVVSYSSNSLSGQRECHDACHPVLAGHAYRDARLAANMCSHPAFFGLTRFPIATPRPIGNQLGLYIIDTLKKSPRLRESWCAFYSPPLCRGLVRQRLRALAKAHDASEIVHPAFWGSVVGPKTQSSALISPVALGFALERQIPVDPRRRLDIHVNKAPRIKRLPPGGGALDAYAGAAGGFDENAEVCHICLGGQLGCPFCYELPQGFALNDYAYAPAEDNSKALPPTASTQKLQLHTDLTTRTALLHHRRRRVQAGDVLVKTMPCGNVVRLRLETGDTVNHLHHLFGSNSPFGLQKANFLYLPTELGMLTVDLEEPTTRLSTEGSRIPNRGRVPLCRYGFNRESARAIFFHGTHESITDVIRVFVKTNLILTDFPQACRVVGYLDHKPATLPGKDRVQAELWNLVALQEVQHKAYYVYDEAARLEAVRSESIANMRRTLHVRILERQHDRQRENGMVKRRRRPVTDRHKLRSLLSSLNPPQPQIADKGTPKPQIPDFRLPLPV